MFLLLHVFTQALIKGHEGNEDEEIAPRRDTISPVGRAPCAVGRGRLGSSTDSLAEIPHVHYLTCLNHYSNNTHVRSEIMPDKGCVMISDNVKKITL